jgi:predicted hydrocarbon binding protein
VAQALSMRSLRDVEQFFLENGVGILTIDPQADGTIHATMAECAGCFGMPRMEVSLCEFECGLVTGFLEGIAGGGPGLTGEEIQCMSLGDFMCKFEIRQSR